MNTRRVQVNTINPYEERKIILESEKLCKSFSVGGTQKHVLKNLDIQIYEGDITIIMGSSGSGKSTLLYALSGMDTPSMGKVIMSGEDISKYTSDQLAIFRRKNCGFVFQSIYLLENMNVLENIMASALLISKNRRKSMELAKELLTSVGITKDMWMKYPNQLSGGECQRVGIVRALINKPEIVFADEPTGALNSSSSNDVLDVFSRINQQGQSIVIVTHDIKTAVRGNRLIYVKDGTIDGELRLDTYREEEHAKRKEMIQAFLKEMGW